MVRFKAGSYNLDNKYLRSIVREEGDGNLWGNAFLLVNMNTPYDKAEEAALHAKMDIDSANRKARENYGKTTVDHQLVILGYNKVDE